MAAKALSNAPSAHFFAKASNSASVASASVVRPVASWKVLITAAFSSAVCAALRPAIFPSPSANATSAFDVNSGFESSVSLYSIVCVCSPLRPVLPVRMTKPPCGKPE